jgi:hypothetical protein
MYGDQIKDHLLVTLIIMLILLMMQLEKLGFVAFDKNPMFLILLRNRNLYHLWDYENQKIIRSRDVIFNEKVMYKY